MRFLYETLSDPHAPLEDPNPQPPSRSPTSTTPTEPKPQPQTRRGLATPTSGPPTRRLIQPTEARTVTRDLDHPPRGVIVRHPATTLPNTLKMLRLRVSTATRASRHAHSTIPRRHPHIIRPVRLQTQNQLDQTAKHRSAPAPDAPPGPAEHPPQRPRTPGSKPPSPLDQTSPLPSPRQGP